MKKICICAMLMLTFLAGPAYSEETGCLQTKNNWIIRVLSDGIGPYGFVLSVTDPATGDLIPLSNIKAFSGMPPLFQCLSGSTTDMCVIESNALNSDVSLACDAAAGTAYIFHDSGGQPTMTSIKDIILVSVGAPVLTTSATLLSFGAVTVNTTKNLSLTASNTGNANLHVTSVTLPVTPYTKISDTCDGATLLPSGTCTITIRFAPTSTIAYTGSFNILSDGGNATISLTGSGKSAGSGPR